MIRKGLKNILKSSLENEFKSQNKILKLCFFLTNFQKWRLGIPTFSKNLKRREKRYDLFLWEAVSNLLKLNIQIKTLDVG